MVILHTWFPATPVEVIKLTHLPDLGHSALQVVDDSGAETYVSFCPDPDTIVGEFTHHFQPDRLRHPPSYAEEIQPDGPYMRRPSVATDQVDGLDQTRIVDSWRFLKDAQYDLRYWNCADVTKLLILQAMDERFFTHIQEAVRLTVSDLREISDFQQVRAIAQYLATRDFIDTRPADVVHLVRVYNRLRANECVGQDHT